MTDHHDHQEHPMTDTDDQDARHDEALADELDRACDRRSGLSWDQVSAAARIVRLAGRLVDVVGLEHVAQARGLEAVLTELVDDIAAQHDADELELPPSAELLYTTPAAASDAAELDRLRRLPGEMTLKSFTAYEYNEAVQALLYPGSDPITGGTRELLVPTVQRVADAQADEGAWWVDDGMAVEFFDSPLDAAAFIGQREVAPSVVASIDANRWMEAERDVERAARERAEAEARQLREAIGDPKKLRLTAMSVRSVSRSASLHLHRIADAAAVAEGAEDRAKFPDLHDRPDTGKECHYLAVTMPHGGLFCNKCGWAGPAEGAEDRGQTDAS